MAEKEAVLSRQDTQTYSNTLGELNGYLEQALAMLAALGRQDWGRSIAQVRLEVESERRRAIDYLNGVGV